MPATNPSFEGTAVTSSTPLIRFAAAALAVVAAVSLAGCGRKGDPTPASLDKPAVTEPRPVGLPIGPSQPEPPKPSTEKKPFLLDFLL